MTKLHVCLRGSITLVGFLFRATFPYYFVLSIWKVLDFLLWIKINFLKILVSFHHSSHYLAKVGWRAYYESLVSLNTSRMGLVQDTHPIPITLSLSCTGKSQHYITPGFSQSGTGLFFPGECKSRGRGLARESSEHWKVQPPALLSLMPHDGGVSLWISA